MKRGNLPKSTEKYLDVEYCDETFEDINSDMQDTNADPDDYASIVLYSRDWTVETYLSQIKQFNFDLDPDFQRRNAWDDERKSRLIESLISGLPVPEIVLAEHQKEKKKFIVLDGKQRLLTIAGYYEPDKYKSWSKPVLKNLNLQKNLNGLSYNDLENKEDIKRCLDNASIRCTVISNYKNDDVLFDIFYRLNSGSVPLTTQELRQVLIRGDFSNFLIEKTSLDPITKQPNNLHKILKLKEPDKRLRDTELLLRLISFYLFWEKYDGNLKKFLDNSMTTINKKWDNYSNTVNNINKNIESTIDFLSKIFNGYNNIGKKFVKDKFETRFNKVLFEVLVLCFLDIHQEIFSKNKKEVFLNAFKRLSSNPEFMSSLEATTKSPTSYKNRYNNIKYIIKEVYGIEISKYTFE